MNRQKRTFKQIIQTLPLAFLLLIGWSFGELLGYVFGMPNAKVDEVKIAENNYAKPIN